MDEVQIEGPEHKVRPRWVWAGLALLLIGAVVGGIGVGIDSAPWWIVGLVIFLLGAAMAWRGKLVYDVSSSLSISETAGDIAEGNARVGRDPKDRAADREIKADARHTTLVKHEMLTESYPRPRLTSLGSGLLIGCAAWLAIAQWTVYPESASGNDAGLRDVGVAVVLALAAFALRLPRPEPQAWGLCLLCGAALIVFGVLFSHDRATSTASELVTGILVVLGCLLTLRKIRHAE